MDISITVEFEPSFYTKTDLTTYLSMIDITMNECSEKLLDYIKAEAPVRTGRLRDGHYLQKGNKWFNIQNEAYYWKYVVFRGNVYINRGLLQFIADKIMEDSVERQVNIINAV